MRHEWTQSIRRTQDLLEKGSDVWYEVYHKADAEPDADADGDAGADANADADGDADDSHPGGASAFFF